MKNRLSIRMKNLIGKTITSLGTGPVGSRHAEQTRQVNDTMLCVKLLNPLLPRP